MKIVIPISHVDAKKLPRFISVLEKFGGLEGHEIVLVPQLAYTAEAHQACARLVNLTKSEVIPMETESPKGWPQSCNAQFQFAAQKLAINNPITPWFWMEIDALPRKSGWAGMLSMEYINKSAKFLGNIVDTPFRRDDGFYTIPGDQMMLGVAMYHQALGRTPGLLRYLLAQEEPWDVYLRHEFKNYGWANSTVIADMWNTQSYRMDGDNLVCDDAPRDMPVSRKRGGTVPSEAFIIHGCKDDSLAAIILGDEPIIVSQPPPDAGMKEPTPITTGQEMVMATSQGITSSQAPAVVITVDCSAEIDIPVDLGDVKVPISDKEWVAERLKEGSLRLGFVAKEWNCESSEARKRVEEAGFVVSGPGWIKPKK